MQSSPKRPNGGVYGQDNLHLYKELLQGDEQITKVCRFVEKEWPGYHKLDGRITRILVESTRDIKEEVQQCRICEVPMD